MAIVSSLIALAATLAAMATGSSYINSVDIQSVNNKKNDGTYTTRKGWFTDTSSKDLGTQFREYLNSNGVDNDYLNSMSDQELGSFLKNEYTDRGTDFLGFRNDIVDFKGALNDFNDVQNMVYPTMPDYQQIYDDAEATIGAENAELEKMYSDLLNTQMSDLNESYNNATNQILSNDYIKNRQLMDTATSELSKSRRNALEMGASAGIRLANNVNTMLSVQNQQAQQSLETSNNLAQMMLNQRQAASGFRSDYYNNMANLKRGTAERTASYANTQTGLAEQKYQNEVDRYGRSYNDNPWYGSQVSYQNKQQSKQYGGQK